MGAPALIWKPVAKLLVDITAVRIQRYITFFETLTRLSHWFGDVVGLKILVSLILPPCICLGEGCLLQWPSPLLSLRLSLWPCHSDVCEAIPTMDHHTDCEESGCRGVEHPGSLSDPFWGGQTKQFPRTIKKFRCLLWQLHHMSWWHDLLQTPKEWLVLLPLISCK